MRSLSDTITRLKSARIKSTGYNPSGSATGVVELTDFGSNPGALGAWMYAPSTLKSGAPLVVVLHGCTQNAAAYDHDSGWSQLAEEYGFAVLLPEQRRSNNMNLCFNWFEPGDGRRDAGEPESIRQMIAAMVDRYEIDCARIYVNGLSAGGAMTSVMLATYPEIFAGGAIIAGLAFDVANGVPQAFDRMRGHGGPREAELAASVRAASPHNGPWPTISIWHGSGDHVVNPSNGDAILAQWRSIHGVSAEPDCVDKVDGYPHREWRDGDGRVVIEDYRITGMGHGTPLATHGDDGCGAVSAHMIEAGISSTRHMARFWGLLEGERRAATSVVKSPQPARDATASVANDYAPAAAQSGVGKVIEDALRAAGLMR